MNTEANEYPVKRTFTTASARRAAGVLIAPYLKPMSQWNVELALLRQMLTSRHLGVVERNAARCRLLSLRQDIGSSRQALAAAVSGRPPHDIFDDLDNSYRRLARQLDTALRNAGRA